MSMFQQQLITIINNIEIAPDLTISHPDYPPLPLDPELSARYSQVPIELQTKFLTTRVRNYLYDLYFTGSLLPISTLETTDRTVPPIKNHLVNGVDLDFFRRLDRSNTSRGYLDPDWQIVAETEDRELVVLKDGLHLHVDRQRYVPPNFHQATIDDWIPVFLPHNLVGIDTYMMVGNLGSPEPQPTDIEGSSPLLRVYFNVSPDGAVAIAEQLTNELNQLGIQFQFGVLHNPAEFYRYDAATLYLDRASYLAAQPHLAALYRSHQADFSPDVPIFTKQLAPGLGIAEEPLTTDPFGIHRCELVAEGLVSAFYQGQSSATDRLKWIETAWGNAQLDRSHPYLNPTATDCYDLYVM
jgi:HopA1 effector protein family